MNKYLAVLMIGFFSCQSGGNATNASVEAINSISKDPYKIYNLMGEEMPAKQFTPATRLKLEENLAVARNKYETNQDSLELIIWYGRRLAYLGRYLDAIEVYSKGLQKFPTSHKLRRHRGHRYLTIREIDKAVQDFEMAAFYSVNHENAIEPDGIPNKLNQPLSNDKFNIYYHYGLAHYLNGRYDKAISAYKKCMDYSDNNDLMVATTYWLYMTYKKIGNADLADELLDKINSRIRMVENDAYLDLLMLFKDNDVEQLLKKAFPKGSEANPTLSYGIGNWYQQNGNIERANEIFLKIMESQSWDSFGFIAAEAELATAFPVPLD